ncbi:MAG TPA: ABC transporter permease [Candidatus Acidoferrum sp.]
MFRDLWVRVRALFRRKAVETELDDELRFHLERQAEKYVQTGWSREQAQRQARVEFGGVELAKEECRDARGVHFVETLLQDLRYGIRTLRKSPGFVVVAVLTLALGIGSNAAVFSLVDALLLRSLDVPAAPELVRIPFGPPGIDGDLSSPMFDRLRERQSVFTDIFAWLNSPMVLSEKGVSRPITGAYATGSAFPTLKLQPRLGRLLTWQDDEPSALSNGVAAVISEEFWLEHFGGDPGVLGQAITVDGGTATIVGVMPRSFNGITVDYSPQVVLPFAFDVALHGKSSCRFRPDCTWFPTMARRKPRVSFEQAKASLATIAGDVLKESLTPGYERIDYLRNGTLSLLPGRTGNSPLGKIYGRELWTLQTLVGLLMIICCANLASLQFSRTLHRQHELVVRSALGAGRLRLVRQLMVESLLLSVSGAAAGLLLSQWMSGLIVRYVEQSDFPVFLDLRPNLTILAAVIALATLTVILTGALPALRLTRFETEEMLRSGAQRAVGRKRHPLAAWLVPGQVALSLVLTSLALLFAASTGKLLRMDPGFRVKGITFFGVEFERRPEKGEARIELYRQMLEALRQAPGIEAASVVAVRPLGEGGIDERAAPVEGDGPEDKHLFENVVGPQYFATAGTRVLAGREFSKFDRFGATPVCVLNQAAANFFFPQQSAIGQHIRSTEPNPKRPSCEVVGVVTDAKYLSLREPAPPAIYYPYEQLPDFSWGGFITRSHDASAAVAAFKEVLHRYASDTPLLPSITMQRQLEDSIGKERLVAVLSLFFGALALLLTSMGLYGLESQRVAQRTPEIGLRMALGAQKGDMLWFIVRQASLLFAIGVPIGLALTFAASRFVASLLFEMSPLDPRIHFVAVATLLAAGFLASYLPARRATRVDPMVALRYE